MVNGFNKNNIKVGFLLLCHEQPADVMKLLSMQYFQNKNLRVYAHYDKKKSAKDFQTLKAYAAEKKNINFIDNRVVGKWGEFSLVEATLNCMQACINDPDFDADYMYLFSGSCIPVKPFVLLQQYLADNHGKEFIEAYDIRYNRWVTGGIDVERYKYYFPFNFISQRKLFDFSTNLQRKLGVNRDVPDGLEIHFGSQWFCLTRETCEKVVEKAQSEIIRKFFRRSWIPDEFAIQTLAYDAVGFKKIANKTLTFFKFNSFGKPLVFYNDHFDYLKDIPFFFARKVSKQADRLYDQLNSYTSSNAKLRSLNYEVIGNADYQYDIMVKKHANRYEGGKIARVYDSWKDGITRNKKHYYVLTGPSKSFIRTLNKKARKALEDKYVIYDYIFETGNLDPTSDGKEYNGISYNDLKRRDYDPIAFLYQIIHSSEKEVVFCIDANDDEKINEIIRWDHQATVILIEPLYQKKEQRLIQRMTLQQVASLATVEKHEISDMIPVIMKNDKIGYWTDVMHEYRNARVGFLEDFENDMCKELKALKYKVKYEEYLPEQGYTLIKELR